MRDIGQQLASLAIAALERVGHVIEAVVERAQIGRAAHRRARRQSPTGDGLRRGDHVGQWVDVATGKLVSDHHGKERQDRKEHGEDEADLPEHIQQQVVERADPTECHKLADDLAVLAERHAQLEVVGAHERLADQACVVAPGSVHHAIGADQHPVREAVVELDLGADPGAVGRIVLPEPADVIRKRRQAVAEHQRHRTAKHDQDDEYGQQGQRQGAPQQPKQALTDLMGRRARVGRSNLGRRVRRHTCTRRREP